MSQADIRNWLPGANTLNYAWVMPVSLTPQKYKLGIAILDPATNKPGVRLANTGRDSEGRYYFSEFDIY